MFFKQYITAKNIFFIILMTIAFYFLIKAKEITMLFFACYVLACSLNPLVNFLEKKKLNRSLATSLVLCFAIIITLAFFIPLFYIAVEQFTLFLHMLPEKLQMLQTFIQNFSFFGQKLPDLVDINLIFGNNTTIIKNILSQSLNLTIGFFQTIVVFVAIVTIIFYLLNDKIYLKNKLVEFFPKDIKKQAEIITNKISSKVGGYVIAIILSNTAIWVMVTLSLAILNVEFAFSLGLISGLLDIIPIVGPTIALTLIIITAYQKGIFIIILAIIFFLAIQQISNNLVRPLVFGKFLDLHPLMIIFALFIGGTFMGIFGVIFAPAIATIISVLVNELYLKNIKN